MAAFTLAGVMVAPVAWAQPDDAEEPTAPVEEGDRDPVETPTREPDPEAETAEPSDPPEPATAAEATTPKDAPAESTEAPGPRAKTRPEASIDPPGGPVEGDLDDPPADPTAHHGDFGFDSYGRLTAATDKSGRPGRDMDITAWGSRLDLDNYAEIELRRNDHWASVGADTRIVSTLAIGNPIFHYNQDFNAKLAVRNLFIEERNLGLEGLSVWAGSRMLRGDDIYLLNMWPLDNLNTLGGGVQYDAPSDTSVRAHFGVGQPNNPFYLQSVDRAQPLNQFGTQSVNLLDRQRLTGSLRAQQVLFFSDERKAGMKIVAYGEVHGVAAGQRETEVTNSFEDVPSDNGYVIGGQLGFFTGEDNTHVNLWGRYATGLAAYADFANPSGLGIDRRAAAAHELRVAISGNYEFGPVTVMAGGYLRSFRNASEDLDFEDVDEGIVIARPHVFFVDWAGLAVEGAFEIQQRGVLRQEDPDVLDAAPGPQLARLGRIGVIPFLSPAGRGSYSRPMIWFIYSVAFRNAGARALYPA
ncbi:MAG: carbohydrate porin, partial [Myxococcales bacterium]|nr:carbohydrate porin [Myxococcales bacterium]